MKYGRLKFPSAKFTFGPTLLGCVHQYTLHERHAGAFRKVRSDAAECALISNLATNQEKRELFARLAEHLTVLASEVERAIAKSEGT
jgi:hypothetical protein